MIARQRILVWGIFCLGLAALAGCENSQPLVIVLDVPNDAPSASVKNLSTVLDRCVDKDGFIDTDKYTSVAGTLTKQLQQFAVCGPTSTPNLYPTREDQVTYWYNARAAWSILLAMTLFEDKNENAAAMKTFHFPLDGQQMTLPGIDKKILALAGYQAVVAAPCVNLQRAALPENPFDAKTIHQTVRRRFDGFVDDQKRFIIDVEAQQVRFPPILWRYRNAIFAEYNKQYGAPQATFTTALLSMVKGSAARRLQDAVGYGCVENTAPGQLALTD